MSDTLAFLGPHGSYAEQAALLYQPQAALVPQASVAEVAGAVERGLCPEGIVPIENSLQGSVTETLDLLIHDSDLFIRAEVVLPIAHCLLAREGTTTRDVRVVFSHPQALAQCRVFLSARLPSADLVASLSTSAGVQQMLVSGAPAAAIANERAAALYGAQVLARGIQDDPNNVTRFVVLGKSDHRPTGADKTSICFSFEADEPGLLYGVLGEFAQRGINLGKVESRPTRKSLGRYFFLIDMDGHREDPKVRDAIQGVRRRASMMKTFGSYPRHRTAVEPIPPP